MTPKQVAQQLLDAVEHMDITHPDVMDTVNRLLHNPIVHQIYMEGEGNRA